MELSQAITICTVIAASVTYIYDYVEAPRNMVARLLSLILRHQVNPQAVRMPKLLECSLCATTWSTLAVLIIYTPWQWWWLCLPMGWSTRYWIMAYNLVDVIITTVFVLLERLMHKIRGN